MGKTLTKKQINAIVKEAKELSKLPENELFELLGKAVVKERTKKRKRK